MSYHGSIVFFWPAGQFLRKTMQLKGIIKSLSSVADTGRPVLADVKIDYTKKTAFTKGVIKTNLSRFPLKEKIRFILRALKRHTIG